LWFTAGESDIQKNWKMESVAIPEQLIKLLPERGTKPEKETALKQQGYVELGKEQKCTAFT